MGDARKALRAYARDIQLSASSGGVDALTGASNQDDASEQRLGSGAPHQLAMAAAAVCVVLIGGIGIAGATTSSRQTAPDEPIASSVQNLSSVAAFANGHSFSSVNALRTLSSLGLSQATLALDSALETGTHESPAVQNAVADLLEVIGEKLASSGAVSESDPDIALAVSALQEAVQPPGLDPNLTPPGQGGAAPGQDPLLVAPGQNNDFIPPGQSDDILPPGQEKPPNPNKGSENNSGGGRP